MIKWLLNGLAKLLLVIGGMMIALLIIELLVRLLPPPYAHKGITSFQCDSMVGWRGQPYIVDEVSVYGQTHQAHHNQRGMRDTDHEFNKPANTFRILVLGDSFIEAVQVKDEEVSHQVLENILNEKAPSTIQFEVISAGITGWGTAQHLLYFQQEGHQYQPDLVLSFWYNNDLKDILPDHRYTINGTNCYAPYFVICQQTFDLVPWFSAPGFRPIWPGNTKQGCSETRKTIVTLFNQLYHTSRLYQQLEPLLHRNIARIHYEDDSLPWLPAGKDDERLQYAYDLTTEIYRHLAQQVAQHEATLAVILIPRGRALQLELNPIFRESLVVDNPHLSDLDTRLPNHTLTEHLSHVNLPVLDLHPHFIEHHQVGIESLYYMDLDKHWNVIGNRKAAEDVAHWLITERLVPIE